jgi:hypothetical protein
MNAQDREQHDLFKKSAEWLTAEIDKQIQLPRTPENIQRGQELMRRCEQLRKEIHSWALRD